MMSPEALGCFLVVGVLTLAYAVIPPGLTSCHGGVVLINQPHGIEVNQTNCGQPFTTEYWRKEPYVFFSKAKTGHRYTVFMLDLEDPKTPIRVYFLNWLVANVLGEDLQKGNATVNGDVLARYIPPIPQEWRPHRYAVVIHEQLNPNVRVLDDISSGGRQYFNLETWAHSIETPLSAVIAGIEITVRQAPASLRP